MRLLFQMDQRDYDQLMFEREARVLEILITDELLT